MSMTTHVRAAQTPNIAAVSPSLSLDAAFVLPHRCLPYRFRLLLRSYGDQPRPRPT
jgi:hypothetical protein